MRKKNNPSISDSIRLIKKRIKQIKESSENENQDFSEIEQNLNEIEKFAKGIKKLFLILFSFCVASLILFFISLYYNQKLKDLNSELNNQKVDSLMTKILNIETIDKGDSVITSYNYYTRNGEVISYNELIEELDSLRNEYGGLTRETIQFKTQLYLLRQKLKIAERRYGIKFQTKSDTENGKTIEYIQITAPKIDSGLMLLEEYRDKIFCDNEKDQWYIITDE